ncbi:hypothetical protein Tco_0194660 [Tanacetum coccineum]
MDTTKAQQIALDDALVAPANRLKIGKCNHRLSSTLKSNEPTIQVVLDALKLTPFYKAFEITANVPKIYMQEFWATVSIHHKSLRFKMNDKSHTLNLENFRDMLQICPRLPGQKFEDPPLEEEILSFIRDLGHTGEIKVLTDVNVNHMHQPWRSFAAIINRCLSGKTTGLDSLRLSRAQIIWGMYHKKNVDYVYLLWEDLVYQVENKNSKKNNDMCYPRFTKVIIDYFMTKDQSISRRNKMFWHTARDDPMFNTIRVISRHQDTQIYGAILPDELTNQDMKDSEAYKQYYAVAFYKKKADESDTSPKKNTAPATKGSRLKTSAKVAKFVKKKQPTKKPITKGLTVLSEVALSEAEQLKLATKRSLIQFHSSHASSSCARVNTQSKVPDEQQQEVTGTNEGDGDDDDDNDDDESDVNDDSEETKSDGDGDDFVHPNLSTYKADDQEEEDEEEKQMMMKCGEEGEEDELYKDVHINLERSDVEMINDQVNQDTEDAHVTLTAEPPVFLSLLSTTTTTIPTITLPEIPNFASLFGFDQRVPALETEMSEFKQTNQFAKVVSSIPAIVDNYLASKLKDAVDVAIQLQTNKLREEAQGENQEFLNQIDSSMKAIIKEQVKAQVSKIMPKVEKYVTESLGAEVLVRSTNQPQTSYAAAASLSEFELKKILIDKMEENKSINRSDAEMIKTRMKTPSLDQIEGKSAHAEEHGQKVDDLEDQPHQEFNIGNDDVAPVRETQDVDERKWNPSSSPTPDRTQSSFNEFLATPVNFSTFIINWLKIENLTQDVLTGPTYDLTKGTCKSVVELEYHLEENVRGRQVIPFDHFINNDLEYLKGGSLSQRYTTSITKTKAAAYGQVKWIEDKDDQLYKFRECGFKRLRQQDIEDMLLLLVQVEAMPKSAWTEKDQIDNFLKERRLMRSLEKFVGGRLYEGDLRLLQRTI